MRVKLTIPPPPGTRYATGHVNPGAPVTIANERVGTVTGGTATLDGGLELTADIYDGVFDVFTAGVRRTAVKVTLNDTPGGTE